MAVETWTTCSAKRSISKPLLDTSLSSIMDGDERDANEEEKTIEGLEARMGSKNG